MNDCTTLRSYLAGGNLFDEIKAIKSFPFLEGVGDTDTLNRMLKIHYGDRWLFKGFADEPMAEVAKMIIKSFADRWDGIIRAYVDLNNLGAADVRTLRENKSDTSTRDNNSETLEKVSAFNSDDLLTDNGRTVTDSAVDTGSGERELVETRSSYKDLINNLTLTQKTDIVNIVVMDVSRYLTISIY